jgi:hypothetical protein
MRIVEYYSHLNGLEFIQFHKPKLWREITTIIAAADAHKCKTKISKEKTKSGKILFAPIEMNKQIKVGFRKNQWHEERISYWVTKDAQLIRKTMHLSAPEQKAEIEKAKMKPIFSYNQTDFVKDRIAVEVQFGKYAFVAFDLFVKHLAFYIGNKIDVGVEILPMKELQAEMSSGPSYYEGELYNLIREGRGVPSVPLVLIGIAP